MRIVTGTTVLLGLALATSCSNTTRQVGNDTSGGAGEDGSGGSSSSGGSGGDDSTTTRQTTSSSSSAGAGGSGGMGSGGTGTSSSTGGSGNVGGSAGTSGASSVGGANTGGNTSSGGTGGGSGGTGGGSTCTATTVEDNVASGSTVALDDRLLPSCGSGSSPELIFQWTAPYSDYFMFDSAGSDFDTVVTVLRDCNGTELACNSTASDGTPQGLAVAEVTGGETYWVAVEGSNGETGEVSLAIAPVVCPSADLTGQPLPATISSVGGTTEHEARCTGQDISTQPEKTVRYVPETAGLYRFSASSSEVRVLLSVYDGAMCGGQYLQCSFGQVGSGAHPAEVTRYLEAGQAVTLVIEGEEGVGQFDVDVELIEDEVGSCDDIPELGTGQSGTVSATTDPHVLSSGCEWAGNAIGSYAEHLYRFTVDLPAGGGSCYINLEESNGVIETYVLEGDHCEGSEFECEASGYFHEFSRNDNGVYTLVIENRDPFLTDGTYTITSTCE